MTKEPNTFYNYTVTGPDGKSEQFEFKSETQYNKTVADAKKTPNTVVEVTRAQTFDISTADTWDEVLSVTPNVEVALSYYNYGLSLAQHNVKRDLMTDPEWAPIEGSYDLLADVQQPKERRVADPLTKSRNALKAFWAKANPGAPLPTDDEINAVLAQFAGAASTAPAAPAAELAVTQ